MSVEFGPAKRWAESENTASRAPTRRPRSTSLHKIDAAGYDAYLTWGRFCVPPLNATGDLADEAFARECQLAVVKGGVLVGVVAVVYYEARTRRPSRPKFRRRDLAPSTVPFGKRAASGLVRDARAAEKYVKS